MDELFAIEKSIGEVQAVFSLQFKVQKEQIPKEEIKYETFVEEEQPKQEEKKAGEGEAEAEQPPAEGEAAKAKKSAFNPKDFTWTATDGRPKNLPQLFLQSRPNRKAAHHEVKQQQEFGGRSQNESISKALDAFAARILDFQNTEAHTGKKQYLY